MKNILKWIIAFLLGFSIKIFTLAQYIGANEVQKVIVFIVLLILVVAGWKIILDWAYEN